MASEKITAIVEELKVLTVLELSELVKAVEEEFGVSAAAAVAVAAPVEGGAAAAEEKTEFDIVLTDELLKEGVVRDIIRQCQVARKDAGYQVEQRIKVAIAVDDEFVVNALNEKLAYIAGELLADAKKPSSEIISNLKVLMMSSRNRDNTNFLEANYEKWNIFFEIMKNYVIINTGHIKHE